MLLRRRRPAPPPPSDPRRRAVVDELDDQLDRLRLTAEALQRLVDELREETDA